MGRGLRIAVGVGLVALVGYGVVSWIFSDKLIAQQFTALGDDDPARFGLPAPEVVTIRGDDVDLAAWYFANPRDAGCAVVMLHGFSGSKAEVLAPTPIFWQRGCDLLLYDARGHGESSRALLSYGVHERDDLLRVVEWLSAKAELARSRIGLIGWSYGAATAIQAASEAGGDVAFVIADSSYSSLRDIANVQAEEHFGTWAKAFVPGALVVSAVRAGFDGTRPAPASAIEDMRSPVLLVHSRQDAFTPVEHSEKIFEASDKTRTRLVIPAWEAAHAHSYTENPTAYTAVVDAFLDELAPGFGGRRER
jgi:pimeloyl-ACP methyl ester carboxylesterase